MSLIKKKNHLYYELPTWISTSFSCKYRTWSAVRNRWKPSPGVLTAAVIQHLEFKSFITSDVFVVSSRWTLTWCYGRAVVPVRPELRSASIITATFKVNPRWRFSTRGAESLLHPQLWNRSSYNLWRTAWNLLQTISPSRRSGKKCWPSLKTSTWTGSLWRASWRSLRDPMRWNERLRTGLKVCEAPEQILCQLVLIHLLINVTLFMEPQRIVDTWVHTLEVHAPPHF